MKPWVAPLIITWAVAATGAAVFFAVRSPEPVAAPDPTVDPAPSAATSFTGRTTKRLRQRVERLRAALAVALPAAAPSIQKLDEGIAAEPAVPPPERMLSLVDELRRLEDGDSWTVAAWQNIAQEMNALLARDPSTHLALMGRLREAADEDAAHDVLSQLTENPVVGFVSDRNVTNAIYAQAHEMLADPQPHLRAAAARVLFAYDRHTREDVLAGLARLGAEEDPSVYDDLLAELSVAALGYGLTEAEARPLVDGLRERAREPDGGWAAGSLARWSASDADLRYVDTLLHDAKGDRAQEILNALDRDTRLVGAHVDASRDMLLAVLEDGARHEITRDMALHFLRGYSPWDDSTADAARRYAGR